MKTLTLLFVFAALLLIVGCAGPGTSYETRQLGGARAPIAAPAADEVQVIESDVGDIASLDEELGLEELEGLEKDLDNLGL